MRMPSKTALLSSGLLAASTSASIIPSYFRSPADHPVPLLAIGGGSFVVALVGNLILLGSSESFVRDRQRFLIDIHCKPAIEGIRLIDPTARMNIMRVEGLFWKKFDFFRTYEMENHADAALDLTLEQGVAGAAVEHETWAVGDLEQRQLWVNSSDPNAALMQLGDPCRGLKDKQRAAVQPLTLIYSYPIRRLARSGSAGEVQPLKEVIGVVNIDSRQKNAFHIHQQPISQSQGQSLYSEILAAVLPGIATAAAYIMS